MNVRRLHAWIWAPILLGIGAAGLRLFERAALGPELAFNATRVATSIGMARGYDIMTGPEEGPVLDFMYGPVSALAYTPAALASTPTGAIWLGIAMSYLFLLAPIAWLLALDRSGGPRAIAALALVCFAVLCLYDPALYLVSSSIHADAPALGLAAAACAVLLAGAGPISDRRLIASALFAVLAVWSKQTAMPIVLALPVFVGVRDGFVVAWRFTLWMGAVGVAVSAFFLLVFGFEGILFTMFQIPGGHRFKSPDGKLVALLDSFARMRRFAAPAIALVVVTTAASYRGGSLRGFARSHPWTCLVWVGLAMAPLAVLGGAKLGGHQNAYAFTTLFWVAAGVMGLRQLAVGRGWAARGALLALAALAVLGFADQLREPRRADLAVAASKARRWRSNPIEMATAFARQHPHQVYFAWNPLIGLYSDGLLYNSIIGMLDRRLAGHKVSTDLMRRYIPRDLRYMAVKQGNRVFGKAQPPRRIFPELGQETKLSELPHHRVWIRRSTPAGRSPNPMGGD